MENDKDWRRDLPAYWFSLDEAQHWRRDDAVDAELTRRFGRAWEQERGRTAEDFLGDADEAFAAILLFDQVPRNIFRDDPRAFATDPLARAIASAAIDRAYDQQIPAERRVFAYLPFEHSEALADQDRSVALFETLGNPLYLDFAIKHRDVIARFGRFPHRNAVLGRASTHEETEFGLKEPW